MKILNHIPFKAKVEPDSSKARILQQPLGHFNGFACNHHAHHRIGHRGAYEKIRNQVTRLQEGEGLRKFKSKAYNTHASHILRRRQI